MTQAEQLVIERRLNSMTNLMLQIERELRLSGNYHACDVQRKRYTFSATGHLEIASVKLNSLQVHCQALLLYLDELKAKRKPCPK